MASYAVKARTPDGKSSVVDVTALFVGDVKRLRPIDPEGGNTYGGWMTAKADYKKDRSMLTAETGEKVWVDTASRAVRDAYARNWEQTSALIDSSLKRCRVDNVKIATGEDYVTSLMKLFKRR